MKRRKLRIWILGLPGLFLLILFGLQLLFLFFGDEVLKKSILLGFRQQMAARYPAASPPPGLDFDNLSLNLLTGNFTVTGLNFKSGCEIHPDPGDADTYFELLIPEVRVEGFNFWEAYHKQVLKLDKIQVKKPAFQMIGEPRQQGSNTADGSINRFLHHVTQGLYEIINPYFHVFSFKKLQIEDASAAVHIRDSISCRIDTLYRSESHYFADHLHVLLEDFHLDSAARYDKERILFAKNMEAKISDYKIMLPDSSYLFRADTLAFSTTAQKLYLQHAEMIPEKAAGLDQDQYFHVKVPEVTLTHIDLQEIYSDNLLKVQDLTLNEPLIQVYGNFDRKNSPQISSLGLRKLHPDSLHALISLQLQQLSVNYFKLKRGRLHVYDIRNDSADIMNVRNIELSFSDFFLDSTVNQVKVDSLNNTLPMDSISLELADVEIYMPDRVHRLTSSFASVKTDRQRRYHCNISFDSLLIRPETGSLLSLFERAEVVDMGYDISIEKALLYDIDLQELSQRKLVLLDSMVFYKPDVRIANLSGTPFGELVNENRASDTTQEKSVKEILFDWSQARLDFHPVIAPGRNTALFYGVYVDHIKIDSGKLLLEDGDKATRSFDEVVSLGNVSVYASRTRIDNMGGRMFTRQGYRDSRVAVHVSDLDLNVEDGILHLPGDGGPTSDGVLQFARASISSARSEGVVERLYIWTNRRAIANDRNQIRKFFVPYIELSGFDFYSLYNLQKADVRRLQVLSPRLTLAIDEQQTSQAPGQSEISVENLFQWIKPYLNSLALQELYIKDAVLKVEKRDSGQSDYRSFFTAEQLNLKVFGFFIDSATQITRGRPLYADDVRLEVKNYQFSIASSEAIDLISLSGKTLSFSTYDNQLDIKQVDIHPDTSAAEQGYKLTVAEIQLSRINLYAFLKYDQLSLNHIRILQPKGNIWVRGSGTEAGEEPTGNDLKPLQPDLHPYVHDYVQQLAIENLQVEQGALEYVEIGQDTIHHIKADTVSFFAKDILIDPRDRRENKILYAGEMDFNIYISDYFLRLDKARQQLIAKSILLSKTDGSMLIEGARLQPLDESVDPPVLSATGAVPLYDISVPALSIEGIDFEKAFLQADWVVDNLVAVMPEINIYGAGSVNEESSQIKSFRDMAGPYIHSVKAGRFSVKRGKFKAIYFSDDSLQNFSAERIDASLHHFYIDADIYKKIAEGSGTELSMTRRLLFADDFAISVKDYQVNLGDSLYIAKADEVELSTKRSDIAVKSFRLEPLYGKHEMNDHFSYRKTRTAARVPEIRFQHVNFERLIREGHFEAGCIDFNRPVFTLFKDKRLPRDLSRRSPLPQEMLLEAALPLTVDSVKISDGFVRYEEQVSGAERAGELTFEKLNAQLYHITNDRSLISQNPVMALQANAYLLGKGFLDVSFEFPLNAPDMYFTAKGSLGTMDLTALNVMLEPVAFVHIKKGMVSSMNFEFAGNGKRSSGTVLFNYNDLSISLVDKENGSPGLDEKVGSFLANAFVLKSDNPKAAFFRVGKIDYERDETRPVVYYWWRSVLSGIKSSIGLKKVGEKIRDFTVLDD